MLTLGVMLALTVSRHAAAGAAALRSAASLARALQSHGRAEATLRYGTAGAGGAAATVRATLALERPGLARLDVAGTGERLVARADGGEWVQPALKQVLTFSPGQANAALGWWRVLLGDDPLARETALGAGHWRITRGEGGAAGLDVAEVWLDARGLPARLVVGAGEGAMTYRLSGWRFAAARGIGAFRLATPEGYDVVEMP